LRIDLREMSWFGRERATGYAKVMTLAFVWPIIQSYQEAMGPVGSDFMGLWTAAKLTLSGHPSHAYIPAFEHAFQAQFGRDHWWAFLCTPPFLAVIAPFGLLPYPLAWPVFVGVTYAIWLVLARRLFPEGFWPIAIYPGAMVAAWYGQNGFVTGALFIAAALALEKRPFLAGLLLAGLIVKPQTALLVPVALLAGRQWRAVAGAGVGAAGLLAASALVFGPETLTAFLASRHIDAGALSGVSRAVFLKMPTVYAAAALAGGATFGAVVQGASTLAMAAIVAWRWWRPGDLLGKCAVLAIAGVLATPYLWIYDLAVLIVPVCWFAREGVRRGFGPWEKLALFVFYWIPLFGQVAAGTLGVNLTAPTLAVFLWLVVRKQIAAEAPQGIPLGRTAAAAI
jgi:hypothetical protein